MYVEGVTSVRERGWQRDDQLPCLSVSGGMHFFVRSRSPNLIPPSLFAVIHPPVKAGMKGSDSERVSEGGKAREERELNGL